MLHGVVTGLVTSVQMSVNIKIRLNKRSTVWKILGYKVNMGCGLDRLWIRVKGTIFWLVFCPTWEVGNKFYLCFSKYLWLLQLHNFCEDCRILVFTLTIQRLASFNLCLFQFSSYFNFFRTEISFHFNWDL